MKIRSRALNWLVARSVVAVCRMIFRTLRIQYLTSAPNTNPYSNDGSEGFIYCVWHDAIAYPMFAGRHVRTAALVSQNFDGTHIALGLKMLGIQPVRGSSSRGGAKAIRELLALPANTHFVITPDGPRGPRREVKSGLVFLAAHSGRRIVPTAFSAARSWKIRGSWTDLSIPKPFTRVYALSGVPIDVKPDATAAELAEKLAHLQTEMRRLGDQADQLAGVKPQEIDFGTESTQAKAA
jgi:lysophospholipid acyltransferase (LPLAT)-like uncharacterized protein